MTAGLKHWRRIVISQNIQKTQKGKTEPNQKKEIIKKSKTKQKTPHNLKPKERKFS